MASNDIEYYTGQPIAMYKVSPSSGEKLDGMTAWSETAYHKRLLNCYFVDADYCHPVSEADDRFTLQFKAKTTGTDQMAGQFNPIITGTNTSVTTDFLVDSGATFLTDGAELYQVVVNTTNQSCSFIIDDTSETTLELDEDIFTATPRNYEIYPFKTQGFWKYNTTTGLISMTDSNPTALTFEEVFTVASYYKLTLTVADLTSGSFTVKFGTTTVATIDSVGEHIIYGQCAGNTNLVLTASSTFLGSIQDDLNVYEVQTNYSIVIFDLDGVAVTSYNGDFTDGIEIGNIFIDLPWTTFDLDCGQYVVGIGTGQNCLGDLIVNGDFSDGDTGWTMSGSSIVNEQLEFNDAAAYSSYGLNTLDCPIINGHSYTVTWEVHDVSEIGETVEGSYGIYTFDGVTPTQVSPSYNPAAQVGQKISLTFTATQDSDTLTFVALGLNNTFAIDDVTLVDNTIAKESEMDGLSECYCVCDPDCTIQIKYRGGRTTFGNFYNPNDKTYMYFRIHGRLRNSNNNDLELNSFKTTMDLQIQPYLNMNKVEELATQPVPEWVHDSLSVALSHPEVIIDGVRYNRVGGYTPNFGDGELSDVVVNVARYNQKNLRNNY